MKDFNIPKRDLYKIELALDLREVLLVESA